MWLDRFGRVDGNLTLVGLEKTGLSKFLLPEQAYKLKPGSRYFDAITLKTSFCDWERASAAEYAAAFGFESGVTEQHEVYRVFTGHTSVVLPAWLLQRALIGAHHAVVEYAYVPSGLEQLCSPILDDEQFSVAIAPRKKLYDARRTPAFAQRVEWFYAFPSAYRAWHSIYRFACAGRIAVELPDAEVLMSVHGQYVGGAFYTHRLEILEMKPLERPVAWAKISKKSYAFANGQMQHFNSLKTQDGRLRSRNNEWKMSDEEWSVIEPIALYRRSPHRPGRHSIHPLRDVVDGVIIKMGSGISFSELGNERDGYAASQVLYKRMKFDGRWDMIIEFLAQSRQPASYPEASCD